MRKFLKHKKGENPVLETLIMILPKLLIFFILIGIGFTIYNMFVSKSEYSRLITNINTIETEMKLLKEGEVFDIPILKPAKGAGYTFILRTEGDNEIEECKEKACLCAIHYVSNKIEEKKCNSFDQLETIESCDKIEYNDKTLKIKKEDGKISIQGTC